MAIKTFFSTRTGVDAVLADIARQSDAVAGSFTPRMVLFFSTSNIDLQKLNAGMKKMFSAKTDVFGCTTAGEIYSGRVMKNSVVVMSFDKETIEDVRIEVVENIRENTGLREAFRNFEYYFGVHMTYLDFKRYVGMVFIDGMSGAEEKVMETISGLTNVQFIGASAGDDLKFKETHVFANGRMYTNAAIVVLIKAKADFGFIKTQSFKKLGRALTATKVDEASRVVLELDDKPAVDAYSEALGIRPEDASLRFMTNPVAIVSEGELYVRSPQQTIGKSIKFYCKINNGSKLELLESTNIVEDTRKAVEKKLSISGKISGIINFSCILRAQELEEKNEIEAYGNVFSGIPTIGFNTYGEELIYHINQTATMLVFK
jgi:hypothetical protein